VKVATDLLFDCASSDFKLKSYFLLLFVDGIDVEISERGKKFSDFEECLAAAAQRVVACAVELVQIREVKQGLVAAGAQGLPRGHRGQVIQSEALLADVNLLSKLDQSLRSFLLVALRAEFCWYCLEHGH